MKNKEKRLKSEIKRKFMSLSEELLKSDIDLGDLRKSTNTRSSIFSVTCWITAVTVLIFCVLCGYRVHEVLFNRALGVRCVIPNNYFVWEATRPISNCHFCANVTEPIVLQNVSRNEFSRYAYSSKPIVVQKAVLHWPAMNVFSFEFFRSLYNRIEDAYRSVDDECQFLHFRSNFISLRDVFSMSKARIENEPGQIPWYVGWGNCDPDVLTEMRSYYSKPHFLPEDSEIPAKEYVFMGYEAGATMHLDFINRLMWQAQLKGSKTWYLKPAPECEDLCQSLTFKVEPGDVVLIDTRVWYHGTTITPGDFSLAIQSEYG